MPDRRQQRGGRGRRWLNLFRVLGTGVTTGASDDDPSGIATYAQAGAQYGLGIAWTALYTLPFTMAIQEMCDRTAVVTGANLGQLARRRFTGIGRGLIYATLIVLLAANTLNIGADLVAIGDGVALLHGGPAVLWAIGGGIAVTVLLMLGSFRLIENVFKALSLPLLAYVVVAVMVHPGVLGVLSAIFIPKIQLTRGFAAILLAVLGTTISPYLFFQESSNRAEMLHAEPRKDGRRAGARSGRDSRTIERQAKRAHLDVFLGFTMSNVVMFAIMMTTALTLGAHGKTDVNSAADAAQALRPFAGAWASTLFAFGFIGSGMLAVPILAGSAASALAGLANRNWGFDRSPRQAPAFYGLVACGTLGGMLLALLHVNPISLLVVTAVVNGIVSVPALVVVMLIASDRKVMRDHRNGRLATTMGWATTAIMAAAAVMTILFTVTGGS